MRVHNMYYTACVLCSYRAEREVDEARREHADAAARVAVLNAERMMIGNSGCCHDSGIAEEHWSCTASLFQAKKQRREREMLRTTTVHCIFTY